MAELHFQIDVDRVRRRLRITLCGSWDLPTVDRYARALADAEGQLTAAGCRPNEALVLIDARSLNVQQQHVAEHYRSLSAHKAFPPHKLAMIVSSQLLKLQLKRIGSGRQRLFDGEAAATEWLLLP